MVRFLSALFFLLTGHLSAAIANPQIWQIEGWSKTDFSQSSVEFSSILSGGPPKDGIPSIDEPQFWLAKDIEGLDADEPVMSVQINGETKAYPLRILTWHEIVNDVVGGIPIAVTYCPLCNAAIVFDRTVKGQVTEFGVSGKLRYSDMIMYDRNTHSWWQQFTGEAIIGAQMGTKLKVLPSRTESWGRFVARAPEGKVLVPNHVHFRQYGANPYVKYDSAFKPFLFKGDFPDDIAPMTYVVAVKDIEQPFVVTLQKIRDYQSLTRNGVTLTWQDGTRSALDDRQISKGRQIGNVTAQIDGQDIAYDLTFAFVTHAFLPDIPIEQ